LSSPSSSSSEYPETNDASIVSGVKKKNSRSIPEKENDILEAALDEADGWSGFRIGRSGIWGSPDLVDGEPGGSFE
jgi:hypothetical protein